MNLRLLKSILKLLITPKYARVSRQSTTRDILKYFTDCKAKLVETSSASVNCVCLTSDI
jgi:hypothetical protein